MKTRNINLILEKWPGAERDLKAQARRLGRSRQQFNEDMRIIADTIRVGQVQVSIRTLISIGIVDYVTVWDAELLLRVAEGMERNDYKAQLAQNRKYEKLSRRAAAPGRSAKEAAFLAILDVGPVEQARHVRELTKEYEKRINEKTREKESEILLLKKEMEFEVELITSYRPPCSHSECCHQFQQLMELGLPYNECCHQFQQLMEMGLSGSQLSNPLIDLCPESFYKAGLHTHKEAYVKRMISCKSSREFPSRKKAKTSVLS